MTILEIVGAYVLSILALALLLKAGLGALNVR